MTGQQPDVVSYSGRDFDLVGIGGSGLFDPARHGLQVRALHTGCWRGYVCRYRVTDRLVLAEVELGLYDPPDELFGAARSGHCTYGPLALPISFTGGLLLGAGFRRELYVHMGFQPAWKYDEVRELSFDHGLLTAAADRSAQMAERRAAQGSLRPESNDPQVVSAWIESTFDNSYQGPL